MQNMIARALDLTRLGGYASSTMRKQGRRYPAALAIFAIVTLALTSCIGGKDRPSGDANAFADQADGAMRIDLQLRDTSTDADGAPQACASMGAVKPCATSLPGLCAQGEQTCRRGDGMLVWGACATLLMPGDKAEASPGTDSCANNADDDCDGDADEDDTDCICETLDGCPAGLACIDRICLPCTEAAQCAPGQGCVEGICGPCTAANHCATEATCNDGQCVCVPSNGGVEICDNLDNDCDGEADEDETRRENHPYQIERCCAPPDSYWCCSPEHGGSESGDIGDCCTYSEDKWVTVNFSCP